MPHVLTLRLAAPLQAWGVQSRFARRMTERTPTKSGVIGLLAAALGLRRTDSLDEFDGLRFGVRVEQPGTLLRDFHTAHNDSGGSMPLSERYYLQDAVFLAGLEAVERQPLERLARAVAHPYFPLFLGRRSCPPDGPIETNISEGGLETVLRDAPWAASSRLREVLSATDTVLQGGYGELLVEPPADASGAADGFEDRIADQPISFDPRRRRYSMRTVTRLKPVHFQLLSSRHSGGNALPPAADPFDTVRDLTPTPDGASPQESA